MTILCNLSHCCDMYKSSPSNELEAYLFLSYSGYGEGFTI